MKELSRNDQRLMLGDWSLFSSRRDSRDTFVSACLSSSFVIENVCTYGGAMAEDASRSITTASPRALP